MSATSGRAPSCALCGRDEPLRTLSGGERVCVDSKACVQTVIESARVRAVEEGDFHPIDGSDDHNGDLCDCETPEVHHKTAPARTPSPTGT